MKDWESPVLAQVLRGDCVNIYPQECLTVWLNRNGRNEERTAVQVELRVTKDGRPEVFLTTEDMAVVKDFKSWSWGTESRDGAGEGKP